MNRKASFTPCAKRRNAVIFLGNSPFDVPFDLCVNLAFRVLPASSVIWASFCVLVFQRNQEVSKPHACAQCAFRTSNEEKLSDHVRRKHQPITDATPQEDATAVINSGDDNDNEKTGGTEREKETNSTKEENDSIAKPSPVVTTDPGPPAVTTHLMQTAAEGLTKSLDGKSEGRIDPQCPGGSSELRVRGEGDSSDAHAQRTTSCSGTLSTLQSPEQPHSIHHPTLVTPVSVPTPTHNSVVVNHSGMATIIVPLVVPTPTRVDSVSVPRQNSAVPHSGTTSGVTPVAPALSPPEAVSTSENPPVPTHHPPKPPLGTTSVVAPIPISTRAVRVPANPAVPTQNRPKPISGMTAAVVTPIPVPTGVVRIPETTTGVFTPGAPTSNPTGDSESPAVSRHRPDAQTHNVAHESLRTLAKSGPGSVSVSLPVHLHTPVIPAVLGTTTATTPAPSRPVSAHHPAVPLHPGPTTADKTKETVVLNPSGPGSVSHHPVVPTPSGGTTTTQVLTPSGPVSLPVPTPSGGTTHHPVVPTPSGGTTTTQVVTHPLHHPQQVGRDQLPPYLASVVIDGMPVQLTPELQAQLQAHWPFQ